MAELTTATRAYRAGLLEWDEEGVCPQCGGGKPDQFPPWHGYIVGHSLTCPVVGRLSEAGVLVLLGRINPHRFIGECVERGALCYVRASDSEEMRERAKAFAEQRVEVVIRYIKSLAKPVAYLYRHYEVDGTLLYVGISLNAVARLGQHSNTAAWYHRIARIEIEPFMSRREAREAERRAIQTERPCHNRRA
jgi:predicted GIY-YIG superfamily endonuclease